MSDSTIHTPVMLPPVDADIRMRLDQIEVLLIEMSKHVDVRRSVPSKASLDALDMIKARHPYIS